MSGLKKPLLLSCGTSLTLSKILIGGLAEKEQYIVSRRASLAAGFDLESIFPLLKAPGQKELRDAVLTAVKECVIASLERPTFATNQEVFAFDSSPMGQAYDLYLALRDEPENKVSSLEDALVLYNTLVRRTKDYALVMQAVADFSYDCLTLKN